jgi:hypothetical protein
MKMSPLGGDCGSNSGLDGEANNESTGTGSFSGDATGQTG